MKWISITERMPLEGNVDQIILFGLDSLYLERVALGCLLGPGDIKCNELEKITHWLEVDTFPKISPESLQTLIREIEEPALFDEEVQQHWENSGFEKFCNDETIRENMKTILANQVKRKSKYPKFL